MIKKTILILSVSAAYFVQAQDVSTIKNTAEVYSNSALNGSGKYQSMAGSMGALGGDVSVLNSNPAGVGVFITNDLAGTLSIKNSKNSTSYNGMTNDYAVTNTDLGNVGGVMTFGLMGNSPWKFVNLGVNYSSQNIEDYSETGGNKNLSFNYPDQNSTLTFLRHAYDRTGVQSKMSIGVAGNYDNRIYVGAGLNFHNAVIDQYDTAQFSAATNGSTTTTLENASKQYTPFSEQSNGFSASVGVIGKVNNQFRLGAALETPTWWTINRVYTEYENPSDATNMEDRSFSSPLKATLSAAFVPNKNLALNVDYSLGLTKPKYKVYGAAETELNNFFDNNYKNLSEIKVGAEYRIDAFRLRGGYGMTTNPFSGISASNSGSGEAFVGKKNTLGAGIGYDFKSFYVDAAYQNVNSEYSNPFLAGNDVENSNYFSQNYILPTTPYEVSQVKNSQNNIYITLGWKF